MGTFSAAVSAKVQARKDMLAAVFRQSVQDIAEIAQTPGPSVFNPGGGRGGHMPIGETGFLRASFTATLGTPPAKRDNPGKATSYDPGPISLVIAGADIGDTVTLAWTAAYARHVHRRYQWAALAAQRWESVVAENTRKAEAMLK
ncbi:hypothetical protein ACO2Q0_02580 [Phenylobacterium sp. VNQ135]|uniref:hypothetical protein n=1 Tax=Phenylobacterium sp. VNQ135 TaxID=3400922 RepID=UPI003BFD464E